MEIEFKNDKEELDFYREMKKGTNELMDDIHDLLGLDKSGPKRIYLLDMGKKELVLLKKAIKNRTLEK